VPPSRRPLLPAPSPPVRRAGPWPLLALAALLAAGCSTYQNQSEGFRANWRAGRVEPVAQELTAKADREADGRDAVIWRLEQATALRAANRLPESTAAFDDAERRMNDFAARPAVRLSAEALSALSNPANLPYEGRAYDRVMANTYKALNWLALGDAERARTELFRAYQRQQDAVADNARRIARAQEEEALAQDRRAVEATRSHPGFQRQLDQVTAPARSLQLYADFVNPFAVWLDGVYFSILAQDGSDLERARKSFERAAGYAPGNPHVEADFAAVEAQFQGRRPGPVTWVVFETGAAPIREQVRIDIPIIVTDVSYVGAAFPRLQPQGNFAGTLTVRAAGGSTTTATVCRMDSVIARDFEAELPAITTRAIVSTLAKGTAAFFANQAANRQDDALGALVRLATMAYQYAVNVADTRTWTTLPKEFQVARLATPADGRVEVSAGGAVVPVNVAADGFNLVYVRSTSAGAPLLVNAFRLR